MSAQDFEKSKKKGVDDAGIKLAPTPIPSGRTHVLPAVYQEYVLQPSIEIDEPKDERPPEPSTSSDFQPKKRDVGKRWKSSLRRKNFFFGLTAFLLSAVVILPYILGAFNQRLDFLPFKFTPDGAFNALGNVIEAFKFTAANDWTGATVNAVWINTVPSLILFAGFIFLAINLLVSVTGMCGALKPRKYVFCAVGYVVCLLAVFIASMVGAESIGLARMDFVKDMIYGFVSNELAILMVFGFGYLIITAGLTALSPDRSGYNKS